MAHGNQQHPRLSGEERGGILRPAPGLGARPGDGQARSREDEGVHGEASRGGQGLRLLGANPVSSGFEDSTYNSLDTFLFTNAQGKTVPVRWAMVPAQPFVPLDPSAPAWTDKNALFDALIAAIHAHPLRWKLVVTVGQPGDPTDDPSVPWPSDRRQVEVGTLTIDRIESEDTSPARDINFDPLILPSGIAGSDDPILSARSAAYSQSFTRREGEPKTPSAVSSLETGRGYP
jgi:catalase